MTFISPHCSYREATFSITAERRGIDNTPPPAALDNMRLVAAQCFEPIREQFGPIRITSFYRSPALNKAIGGSQTSDHCLGRSIDVEDIEGANADLFAWARVHLVFDQLISEFGTAEEPAWVHISYRPSGNRQQVLRATRVNGAVRYTPFVEAS